MVTPAFVYALFNTAINVGVLAYGPASKIVIFGPLLSILQLYMCILPLFLPVPQVCHLLISICGNLVHENCGSETALLMQKPFGSSVVHLAAISGQQVATVWLCLAAGGVILRSLLDACTLTSANLAMRSDYLLSEMRLVVLAPSLHELFVHVAPAHARTFLQPKGSCNESLMVQSFVCLQK